MHRALPESFLIYPILLAGSLLFQNLQCPADAAGPTKSKTVSTNPKSASDREFLGDEYRRRGNYESASTEYKAAILIKDSATVREKLGDVFLVLGKEYQAISEYEASLRIKDTASTNLKLGSAYMIVDEIEKAIAAINRSISLNPYDLESAIRLHGAWQQAVRKKPMSPENHIGLGVSLQMIGDFDQAKQEFELAIRLSPSNKNAQAQELLSKMDNASATFKLNRSIENGIDLQKRKLYDGAIEVYKNALREASGNKEIESIIFMNIGSVYQAKGDLVNAKSNYESAWEANPNNKELQVVRKTFNLGGLESEKRGDQRKERQTDEAKSLPEKADSTDPKVSMKVDERQARLTVEEIYKKLTAMELRLLKANYSTDGLSSRIERLETKIFGKAQGGAMMARVQQLETKTTPPPVVPSDKLAKVQQELTRLETAKFGKKFESEDIVKRLERLEIKQFGKVGSGKSTERLDALLLSE